MIVVNKIFLFLKEVHKIILEKAYIFNGIKKEGFFPLNLTLKKIR